MKFIFIRHAKDDDKYRGGWSNLDITDEGRTQALKLAKYLKENDLKYNPGYLLHASSFSIPDNSPLFISLKHLSYRIGKLREVFIISDVVTALFKSLDIINFKFSISSTNSIFINIKVSFFNYKR